MNERQRRFAEFYAANPNATEAAKAAGYSERTAYSMGQRLLKNDEIKIYLRELQDRLASERIATVDEVKGHWTAILRDGGQKTSDRLRAGELLARAAGEFTHPVELNAHVEEVEPEDDDSVNVRVCVPYNGRDGAPNAVQMPDGTIVPLAGATNDGQEAVDVLIYAPFDLGAT